MVRRVMSITYSHRSVARVAARAAGALALTMSVPGTAAADSAVCAPPASVGSDTGIEGPVLETASTAGGEVTTTVGNSSYTVSVCGADGVWDQTAVMTPYGTSDFDATWVRTAEFQRLDSGLVRSIRFDLADPAAAAPLDPEGAIAPLDDPTAAEVPSAADALEAQTLNNTTYDGTGLAEQQATALDQCSATGYGVLYSGGYLGSSFGYKIRLASIPFGNAATAIRAAHSRWNDTSNGCGFNDTAESTNFVYGGDASTGFHTYADGVNVVDFGSMSNIGVSDPAVIAVTANFTSGGRIVQSDIRLSTSRAWTTSGAAGAFDIEAVVTHEVGHRLGLDDLGSTTNSNLTMYGRTSPGSIKQRTLGKGDILGMRALY